MKKTFFIVFGFLFSISVIAQGNSGKGKNKSKENPAQEARQENENDNRKDNDNSQRNEVDEHNRKVWEGTSFSGKNNGPKASKNQPAKVRAAFQRDYPYASNVSWSKYRGDWTATFRNGPFYSTAVYHANGDRRDTRTPILRAELPPVVIIGAEKKLPGIRIGGIIKIELPGLDPIFRLKTDAAKPEFLFFNKAGVQVTYDY